MHDRLVSLAGASAALVIVFILLMPHESPDADKLSLPTTEDRGPHGLQGLKRWLDDAGIRTLMLRRRYNTLADRASMPGTGNLLITSLPHRRVARDWERQHLVEWVRKGNSILILAAVSDSPLWSIYNAGPRAGLGGAGRTSSFTEVMKALGFTFAPEKPRSSSSAKGGRDTSDQDQNASLLGDALSGKRAWRQLHPQGHHPVLRHVDTVGVSKSIHRLTWRLEPNQRHRAVFVLLRHDDGAPGLWQARIGEGTAWISAYADLFGNVSLGQSDNARLLSNLVQASLAPKGVVLFDDIHQGLSDLYDPEAFYKDSRVHHTLWFVIALWVVYIVGRSNRLAPLRSREDRPQAVDFTRAVGGLFARRVSPARVAGGLVASFFNEVRAGHGLPTNGEPVWDLLARSSKINTRALAALQTAHARLPETRRADLVRLTNLIRHIRMELT